MSQTQLFFRLLSVEWVRISRRPLLWITVVGSASYPALSLGNFYSLNRDRLLSGALKMPGASFDLANSLDQLVVAIPLLIILSGMGIGDDFGQHTNRLWLIRSPRASSLLAKLLVLSAVTVAIQVLALLAGGALGLYYKTYVYRMADVLNVDWLAVLSAVGYMTLVNLPYLALALAVGVWLRSTFFGILGTLGYSLFVETLLTAIFFNAGWVRWLITNVHFSASYLLNLIGGRSVEAPSRLLAPHLALALAAAYTVALLAVAILIYRRQDIRS
ncbi:MAG: ABC transporter permease [Anaerolineae bacterium]